MGCGKDDCGCSGGGVSTGVDAMAMMAQMSAPEAAHELMSPLVGTFRAQVSMWWEPGGEPHVSTGTMVNTWVLGKRWVEEHYKSDDGFFAGQGLIGYNKTSGKYEGMWIDSMSTFMQFETGNYDPKTRTYEMHSEMLCPQSGVPMKKRSVIRVLSDNEHTMEMYFSAPGQPGEEKAMEIKYKRA
jgi:hypothetical protein